MLSLIIPAMASAYEYYDYRVKNYQYEYDLRPLKRLYFYPWTEGGPGVSIYYDTGYMDDEVLSLWDAHWSWFPLLHLGGDWYYGEKRSFIEGKEYLEKVTLQKHWSGLLYIRYDLVKGMLYPAIYDKHLGTKKDYMYLYDHKW